MLVTRHGGEVYYAVAVNAAVADGGPAASELAVEVERARRDVVDPPGGRLLDAAPASHEVAHRASREAPQSATALD